jgi:hypothetical protein
MRSTMTSVASLAIPLASLISLTACRGVVVAAAPAATASTAAGTAAAVQASATASPATASASSAPATAPGAGQLAVSMTSPVSANWTSGAAVTCARTAVLYLASADNTQAASYNQSFAVRVAPYRGPGTYRALVTFTVTGPNGGIASLSGVPASSVTITSTGGTFTIDRTGADGNSVDATVTWTCP